MIKSFHVGIKALIVHKNKVLLLREADLEGNDRFIYDLPGGRIEGEESFEEALTRELEEETGIKEFKLGEILSAYRAKNYCQHGSGLLRLIYKVTVKNPKIKLSPEHVGVEWVGKKDLKMVIESKTILSQGIREALEIVLK